MTPRRYLEALVLRVQDEFLDTPALDLTLAEAQRRFGMDALTSQAVLGALVDAGVLARTDRETYVRFFPHGAPAQTGAPWAGHAA